MDPRLARTLFLIATVMAATGYPVRAVDEEIDQIGKRVVGGEPTTIEKHPWQVALIIKGSLCGGSLIGDRWVLTAAHCFKPSREAADVKTKAGLTNIADQQNWADVDRVFVHEGYNPDTYEDDVALVRLKSAPPLGKVIPLATWDTAVSVGQPLEVTGWGYTSEGGRPSPILRVASVPVVDQAVCNAPDSYNGKIKVQMLCAGHKEGGIDSCQGDSGGPLVLRDNDGAVLVGVVSWGIGCARKLKYGVYSRVANYRTWISGIIVANHD